MNRKKGIRNFLKSMKFRLICLFMLIGILTGILIRTGILTAYEKHAVSNRSVDVIGQAKILANQMVSTDYINGAESESITSQLQQMSRVYDGRILVIDSSFHIIKDTYDLDTDKTIISEEVIKSFRGEDSMNYDVDNHYVEMTIPLTTDNVESGEKSIIGVLLISVSTDSILANLEYMRNAALVLQIFGAVLLFAVSVFLSVRLTNPLKNMASSIAEIQNGYGTSDGELMIKDYSETVQISEKFNKLYSRMKMLDDSRQEFVSNVSHELKTPLTSMKVLADSLNGQEDVPVELYREFMLDIGNEIERENKIINDLLTLVKMDKNASEVNISEVNINEFLEAILKQLQPIADKRNIEMIFESVRSVTAQVDEVKLAMAFRNLIENAIKYNYDNGWVRVSLNADHKFFYLKVSDSGVGIPEELQDSIFERFYRVDKARSRETGGNGLGLAITRNAILLHRGSIKVHSIEQQGTTFAVRIPLMYSE